MTQMPHQSILETIIRVSQKNHAIVVVSCEDSGVMMEISEFFTFFANGYKFMPAFRNRMWDGRVRLLNARNGELPAGLLHHLKEFCMSRGYTLFLGEGLSLPGTTVSYTHLTLPTNREV